MVEMSNIVPEFAGYYFEPNGMLVVRVRDTRQGDAVTAAARDLIRRRLINTQRADTPPIVVRSAEFTFLQLAAWRDLAYDALFTSIPSVTMLDLDEVANRVVVGVDRSAATARAEVMARLAGIGMDTTAVTVEPMAPYVAASAPATIKSRADVLAGGLEITWRDMYGQYWICTLGAIANRSGTTGFLTASHCSDTPGVIDYTPAAQLRFPEQTWDGRQVAQETYDRSWYYCGIHQCINADASFWAVSSAPTALGLVHRTTTPVSYTWGANGSFDVDLSNPYWKITLEDFVGLSPGGNVNKVGERTGWTGGYVTRSCIDVDMDYGRRVRCATESNMYLDHGDSGSPVFYPTGRDNEVVFLGILFGIGSNRSLYSDYWRVWGDLQPLSVLRPWNLSVPVLSGSISNTSPVISWSAVSGATTYHIYRYYDDGCGAIDGPTYLGQTGNLYNLDIGPTVRSYRGTSEPGAFVAYYAYYIYAASNSDWSYYSPTVYFEAIDQPCAH